MNPVDRTKEVTFGQDAHIELRKGVEIMRKAVGSTYGVGGRNVLIQKKYVHPILTRDGVAVARDIAGHGNKLPNKIQAEAAKLVYQASEKTNKTAGDGTTATVVLLAALYQAGYEQIISGKDAMVIKRALDRDREVITKFIESKSVKCDEKKLKQVAYIACGDQALADMVSDLVYDVGADGAITISYHNAPTIEIDKVTGYLFNQGFKFLQAEVQYDKPLVFVTQKRLSTKSEIIPILEIVGQVDRPFIIVGDVADAALNTLILAVQKEMVNGLVIPPPAFGADGHDYFEDIAIYTGARLWLEGDAFKDVKLSDFGEAKGSRVSRDRAIIYGNNKTGDAIAERMKLIKEQQQSTDVTPSLMENLEQRYAKLAGKVSIIKVGAATEFEREELFFRVEDAVEACKSALSSGVVAGGATTLLWASKTKELEPFVQAALQQPFRLLMDNAAEDAGYRKGQVLETKYGMGFDLRNMTDKPISVIEAGVVDATKVVLQVVQNAFSVAAGMLTIGTTVTEVDDEVAAKDTTA